MSFPGSAESAVEQLSHEPEVESSRLRTMEDRLRAQRATLLGATECALDLPGWQGMLVAKYELKDPKDLAEIGRKVSRAYPEMEDRILFGCMDQLISCCIGIYYREDDGSLTAIDPDGTGVVKYGDTRLADVIGFDSGTARQQLLQVFGGNHIAIIQHNTKLSRWMGDPTRNPDEQVLGE